MLSAFYRSPFITLLLESLLRVVVVEDPNGIDVLLVGDAHLIVSRELGASHRISSQRGQVELVFISE